MGCKLDLGPELRKVSVEKGQELAIRNGARYVEVSALTGQGIDDLFQSLTKSIFSRQQQGWKPDARISFRGSQQRKSVLSKMISFQEDTEKKSNKKCCCNIM